MSRALKDFRAAGLPRATAVQLHEVTAPLPGERPPPRVAGEGRRERASSPQTAPVSLRETGFFVSIPLIPFRIPDKEKTAPTPERFFCFSTRRKPSPIAQ